MKVQAGEVIFEAAGTDTKVRTLIRKAAQIIVLQRFAA